MQQKENTHKLYFEKILDVCAWFTQFQTFNIKIVSLKFMHYQIKINVTNTVAEEVHVIQV